MKSLLQFCILCFSVALLSSSCNEAIQEAASTPHKDYIVEGGMLRLEIDQSSKIRLVSKIAGTSPLMQSFQNSDYLVIDGKAIDDFVVETFEKEAISDERGAGFLWNVVATSTGNRIKKHLRYLAFDRYPSLIFSEVAFTNMSDQRQILSSWNTNHIRINNTKSTPSYYAFQGSSTSSRRDWIREIDSFYYDKNYMGMNNSDYGGGIPVVDLWREDVGVAIGHTALTPKLVNFPTELKGPSEDASVRMSHDFDYPTWIQPGEKITAPPSFYNIHTSDYYSSLKVYSEVMVELGIEMVPSEDAAYEPIWCAWGYERDFTKEEIIGTLDKVKELGIKWAVVDDGFQVAEGDWNLDPEKFPKGNAEMKEIVDSIHSKGLKAKIWWTPLAADPGSKILQEHPKAIIYTEEWAPQFITWWDAYYLSPTNDKTQSHTKDIIKLFVEEWGFDGLKMDGQHMNAVPPDHNPEAQIENPEESTERLPGFFRMIYDETTKLKANAVIENCPCGTCMSFYNMASMNQAVSSDPLSSWQIRHKGKTYKALVPHVAYYGDHVELSDHASDFASSFGIGAVLGTKFTFPKDNPTASESFLLTPEKEETWRRWFSLYNTLMLSKGEYLGELYDIGFDKPETHLVKRDGDLYYAFYAENWEGPIQFRGHDETKTYEIYDYLNDTIVGKLRANQAVIDVSFSGYLLVKLNEIEN